MHRWLAASIVMLTGCSSSQAELEYHRVELPGFSFDAPEYLDAKSDAAYGYGELSKLFHGATSVTVLWQPGDSLAGVADGFPELIRLGEPRAIEVAGNQARQTAYKNSSGEHVIATAIRCGKRTILFAVVGPAVSDRVLHTFRCTPVARREQELDHLSPIGVDDPKTLDGWRYGSAPGTRPDLQITNGVFDANFIKIPRPAAVSLDDIHARLLPHAFTGTFVEDRREQQKGRDFEIGTLKSPDEQFVDPVVITAWLCDGGESIVFANTVVSEPGSIPAAIDFLGRLRCAKPGDPPLRLGAFVPAAE